jgi:hypothetical protein
MTSRTMLALAAVLASASLQRVQAQPATSPASAVGFTCELDLVLEKGLWVARGQDVGYLSIPKTPSASRSSPERLSCEVRGGPGERWEPAPLPESR